MGSGHPGGAVVKVDDSNFQQEVLETDELVMVEFFAPWCGHCTKLKPEYEQASEQLRGVAKLVAVDATAATGLAQQFGIQGFPTIKVFPKGKKNPKKFEDYQGPREAGPIAEASE
jgi:protein disulfide-isomerase A6